MTFEKFVFYVFALILVYAAVRVITVRNPVHAVLHLVLAFFSCAAIWLLLEAEFLAITLVLVYVGAVMVLFLFVVMMLDINVAPLREGFIRYLPVGAAVAALMIFEMFLVVGAKYFGTQAVAVPPGHGPDYSNTRELGSVLYTDYVYPFEIAAVISNGSCGGTSGYDWCVWTRRKSTDRGAGCAREPGLYCEHDCTF